MTGAARDGVASSPGTLFTRLPGHAQQQTQPLKGFEKSIEELKRRYKPVFCPILVPKAEDIHRGRVQLECGCIHEVFTRGKDDFPDARSWSDPITQRRLPAGEYWCTNGHGEAGRVYRDVVEWLE